MEEPFIYFNFHTAKSISILCVSEWGDGERKREAMT